MIGAKILLLGSENPVDDPAREIEILNQIIQDPTLDGLIMTTPQAGAYDDIVKTAEKNGIPVATTNSFDGGIFHRLNISHTGQDASAAAIAGAALGSVPDRPRRQGRFDRVRRAVRRSATSRSTTVSQLGLQRDRRRSQGCRQARRIQGRCGPGKRGHRRRPERPGQQRSCRCSSRVVTWLAPSPATTCSRPALCQGGRSDQDDRQDLRLRLRPWPGTAGGAQERAT